MMVTDYPHFVDINTVKSKIRDYISGVIVLNVVITSLAKNLPFPKFDNTPDKTPINKKS